MMSKKLLNSRDKNYSERESTKKKDNMKYLYFIQ